MKSASKPPIVFFIIGILLVVISYLMVSLGQPSESVKFWSAAVQNIAFIVLTIVIVDFLWQVMGGEPVNDTLRALAETLSEMRGAVHLLQDSKETGLHRLYAASGTLGSHKTWMERLKASRSRVDLMGYTLHVWTRGVNFEEEVVSLVKAGTRVRVLIMDETNPALTALINDSQIPSISPEAVVAEIKAARKTFDGIRAKLHGSNATGSYEFRVLKKGLILTQLCRTDAKLTAVQYLYSVVASRSPLFEVEGADTELFSVFMKEFESLWALGEPP